MRAMTRWVTVASTRSTKKPRKVGAIPKADRLSVPSRIPAIVVVTVPVTSAIFEVPTTTV